jgi:hypothetical protein
LGNRNWVRPGQVWNCRTNRINLGCGYQEGQPAIGGEEASGDWERFSESFNGAQGDYLVSLKKVFCAGVLYIDVRQCKGADYLAKEGGLLMVGFDEGHRNIGGPEFHWNAGKAGARAKVRYSRPHRITDMEEVASGEEGFAEVAGNYFFWIADGGEVDAGVPTQQ